MLFRQKDEIRDQSMIVISNFQIQLLHVILLRKTKLLQKRLDNVFFYLFFSTEFSFCADRNKFQLFGFASPYL